LKAYEIRTYDKQISDAADYGTNTMYKNNRHYSIQE